MRKGTGLTHIHPPRRPRPSTHALESKAKRSGEAGAYEERCGVIDTSLTLNSLCYYHITYNLNTEISDCDYSLVTLDLTRRMWITVLLIVSLTL